MKMKNNKGFTGVDIAVSTVILIIFVSLITTMFYNLSVTSKKIERKTIATNLAIQTIEAMKIIEFDDLTETITIDKINNLIEKKIEIPNGYEIEVAVDNITYPDIIKIISAQVNYKSGKNDENVKIETLVKNYKLISNPIIITANLAIKETGEKNVKLVLTAINNSNTEYNYKIYVRDTETGTARIIKEGRTNLEKVETDEFETFFDVGIKDAYAEIEYGGNSIQTNHVAKEDLKIKYEEELKSFRNKVNAGNTYEGKIITQISNIDLHGSESNKWIPIGTSNTSAFKGIYEGKNNNIQNLYVNTTENYQGLFGYNSGSISNLTLTSIFVKTTGSYCGGLAGNNTGNIENIKINGGTVIGNSSTGGVVGDNLGGTITSCTNSASITYTNKAGSDTTGFHIGGIAGSGYNGKIQKCLNSGDITGSHTVGGIVGEFGANCTIDSCANTGNVTSNAENNSAFAGGIVGLLVSQSNGNGTITNCYNTGNVSSVVHVGGITAQAGKDGCTITIQNCYNVGNIIANSVNSSIDSTYFNNGGIIGCLSSTNYTVNNNYWLKTCGTTYGVGVAADSTNIKTGVNYKTDSNLNIEAKPVDEDSMKKYGVPSLGETNYKSDNNNINNGYPILLWQ